jgi:hypothetical protein
VTVQGCRSYGVYAVDNATIELRGCTLRGNDRIDEWEDPGQDCFEFAGEKIVREEGRGGGGVKMVIKVCVDGLKKEAWLTGKGKSIRL